MPFNSRDQVNKPDVDYAGAIIAALQDAGQLPREALMAATGLSGYQVNAGLRWLSKWDHIEHIHGPEKRHIEYALWGDSPVGRVYALVMNGPANGTTKAEIARHVNLSRAEIDLCLRQLRADGWVKPIHARWIATRSEAQP